MTIVLGWVSYTDAFLKTHHSTVTEVVKVSSNILLALDCGDWRHLHAEAVELSSKCKLTFDTVNHDIHFWVGDTARYFATAPAIKTLVTALNNASATHPPT